MMNDKKPSPWKSLRTGLAVLLALIVFAYGFEITNIDLAELRSERRQQSLQRVTRALAQPDIFEFAQEEQQGMAPVYVTCPADGANPEVPAPDTSGPYMTVTPTCAEPEEVVTVEGFNFFPNASGPVRFVPGNDPTNVVELGNGDGDEREPEERRKREVTPGVVPGRRPLQDLAAQAVTLVQRLRDLPGLRIDLRPHRRR